MDDSEADRDFWNRNATNKAGSRLGTRQLCLEIEAMAYDILHAVLNCLAFFSTYELDFLGGIGARGKYKQEGLLIRRECVQDVCLGESSRWLCDRQELYVPLAVSFLEVRRRHWNTRNANGCVNFINPLNCYVDHRPSVRSFVVAA